MSQTYHCTLKASVSDVIRVDDQIQRRISLTEILPAEEMKDLLRQALADNGFAQEGGGGDRWIIDEGDEHTVLDLDEMVMTTTRSEARTVQKSVTATGRGYGRSSAKAAAKASLEEAKASAQRELGSLREREQADLSAAMAENDEARQELMHHILQQVYAESLKRKARQLGDVMEISEGTSESGEYELVIKVEA